MSSLKHANVHSLPLPYECSIYLSEIYFDKVLIT